MGLGDGRQKLFFLPEPHTDFIFSIIGEELGFVGTVIVVLLFLVIIWRGVQIALKSLDLYGAYLSLGLTSLIGVQAMVNLAVSVGLLPTKGLTLPFVSMGGSSLIVSMVSAGVLLNISKNAGVKRQRSATNVRKVAETQMA
jgi:cell division protein FtsW